MLMTPSTFATRWNLDAIEAAYQRWRENPASVDDSWRRCLHDFKLDPARDYRPT